MEEVLQNQAVLDRQPKDLDPKEVSIRKRLEEELLKTEWAKMLFAELTKRQLDFFESSLGHLDDPRSIREHYLKLLSIISDSTRATITFGEEQLSKIDPHRALAIVTNHLGTAKLTRFSPNELGLDIPIDTIEPFPIRHAPMQLVAGKLDRPIFETAIVLPPPISQLQEAAGVILVPPPNDKGGFEVLRQRVLDTIDSYHTALLVMYPEGGTSGKESGRGPYDLERFRKGAFGACADLEVPILPVSQYFNPNSGFELGIFPVIHPKKGSDLTYFDDLAEETREMMEQWLEDSKTK